MQACGQSWFTWSKANLVPISLTFLCFRFRQIPWLVVTSPGIHTQNDCLKPKWQFAVQHWPWFLVFIHADKTCHMLGLHSITNPFQFGKFLRWEFVTGDATLQDFRLTHYVLWTWEVFFFLKSWCFFHPSGFVDCSMHQSSLPAVIYQSWKCIYIFIAHILYLPVGGKKIPHLDFWLSHLPKKLLKSTTNEQF